MDEAGGAGRWARWSRVVRRWWWDDGQDRWFRVADQEDVLEVEAEDVGGTSLVASLLTTLSSQDGNGCFRFVARARSADPRWPSYAMAGATFPATRPSLEDVAAQAPGWRPSVNASRIFRDTKQSTGLGACQGYTDAAMVRHVGLVLLGFVVLQHLRTIPAKASPPSRNDGS